MRKLYIVTGANGHLGNTIIRMLRKRDEEVRGLLLPSEERKNERGVTYITGDVRDKETLRPLFEGVGNREIQVIHTAGIIDIADRVSESMYQVNVGGTKNIVELCLEYHVKRLVYVSSVHAIPEKEGNQVIEEVREFSPEKVVGGYAKTKAEATEAVLDAVSRGLDAVVVQPSGILGPYDVSGNHLVQMVGSYIHGRLPACVKGGYDFVDVRDVARGTLAAAQKGRKGECYILSNRHYEIKDVLGMIKGIKGGKKIPTLPMWMAKAFTPLLEGYAKLKKQRPLYTRYSLYTLSSNGNFSHDKATKELGYYPRDLYKTLKDTIRWLTRKR
ncbi:NAD-dependent epimerase/dehydratase family protein [Murimonas intestini]|uniref:NAD-dependent epimerase/dehydratase family protein n=1 Tax=Murimonas intestini TaxID=1337051 RepID=UPI0011DCFE88|nr:NAD-dependent epimerase/dehydratase family protein [Murimonas intestini]